MDEPEADIQAAADNLAEVVSDRAPPGALRDLALTCVQDALRWALLALEQAGAGEGSRDGPEERSGERRGSGAAREAREGPAADRGTRSSAETKTAARSTAGPETRAGTKAGSRGAPSTKSEIEPGAAAGPK